MLKHILPLIPEHRHYVEPFFGSGAVFFAKEPAPLETINDIDGRLINFFKVLKHPEQGPELIRQLQLTPHSRQLYREAFSLLNEHQEGIDAAAAFFYVARLSFSGAIQRKNLRTSKGIVTAGRPYPVTLFMNSVNLLQDIHIRLRECQIENAPGNVIMERYNRKDAFFYVDPPYVQSTRDAKLYDMEMSDQDHDLLVSTMLRSDAYIMVSGYDHPIYQRLDLAGWLRVSYHAELQCDVVHQAKRRPRTEILWMNYDLED